MGNKPGHLGNLDELRDPMTIVRSMHDPIIHRFLLEWNKNPQFYERMYPQLAEYIYNGKALDRESQHDVLKKASEQGHLFIVQFLNEYFHVDINMDLWGDYSDYSEGSYTAFEIAAEHGHLKLVQYLFSGTKHKDEALWYAARKGHLMVVQFLIEQGLDEYINTALTDAKYYGHDKVAQYLRSKGGRDWVPHYGSESDNSDYD